MCGIAGLIHRGRTGEVGREMTEMLKSLKHRGPDSTGYALYGKPKGKELVIRFKVAEQDEMYRVFTHYKRDEWEKFMCTVTDWDLKQYWDYLP